MRASLIDSEVQHFAITVRKAILETDCPTSQNTRVCAVPFFAGCRPLGAPRTAPAGRRQTRKGRAKAEYPAALAPHGKSGARSERGRLVAVAERLGWNLQKWRSRRGELAVTREKNSAPMPVFRDAAHTAQMPRCRGRAGGCEGTVSCKGLGNAPLRRCLRQDSRLRYLRASGPNLRRNCP